LDCAQRGAGGDAEVPDVCGGVCRAIYRLRHIAGGCSFDVVAGCDRVRGEAFVSGNANAAARNAPAGMRVIYY
jgi:hypothetical protein